MHFLYRSNNFWKAPYKSSCVSVSMTFVTASFISSIVSWRQPLSLGNNQKSQGARSGLYGGWGSVLMTMTRMELRTGALSWWKCHWRDLKSAGLSLGISPWTPLKPQHSKPNPNPLANKLWCIDFLTPPTPLIIAHRFPAFLESLMPHKNWRSIHARWSESSLKHSIRLWHFSKFKTQFYCISFF